MAKKHIYLLAFVTLIGFSTLGLVVLQLVSSITYSQIFDHQTPIWLQVGIGILVGVSSAFVAWALIQSKWIRPSSKKYADLIRGLNLNVTDIIILSFCAGFGEEILFRACIQNYLGIWLTAFLFVAIHGYLSPKDWRIFIYGIVMVGVIAVFGYLYEVYKTIPPAVAHLVFDVILLWKLSKTQHKIEYE